MRRMWWVAIVVAAGCASSAELENHARTHTLRADAAAKQHDYVRAADEQREAQKLHEKAIKRAYKEGREDVIVPAVVPARATP